MTALLAALLGLLGGDPRPAPHCVVSEGPLAAETRHGDVVVRARDGALEVRGRRVTPCDGLPGPHPSALVSAGDTLWVGFRAAGLYAWRDGRFLRVPGLDGRAVRSLTAVGTTPWIGTDRGVYRLEDGRARRLGHWVLGRREVTALRATADGNVHVGAGPYGWWRIPPEGPPQRVDRKVFAGCFTLHGAGPQVVRAHPPGRRCALGAAAPASGLPSAHVTTLERHGGALYVGTFDAGLARRVGTRFVPVPGAPRFVNALRSQGRTLWIGTPKGLYTLADGVVRRARVALPSDHVNGLALDPTGTLWIATGAGLVGLGGDGVRLLDKHAGLPGRIVYAVAVAADGAIWAGTAGGAARVTPEGVTTYTHAGGQLPHDWVNALLPDGDSMLAGTYDAGVARLEPDGRGAVVPGLEGAWVNPGGLIRLGDAVAVTTLGGGLWIHHGGETTLLRAKRQQIPSDDVTAILRHGATVWVGTRGGLATL